jgi:predicted Zn-dependent protease
MPNLYERLGVDRGAKLDEIRRAYSRLARDRHPDRFTSPDEKQRAQDEFRDITTAFNTLSNERRRQEYDAELDSPQPKTPAEQAQVAYARGCEQLKAQDFHEAVEQLRVAVHLVPSDASYRLALAQALAKNPNWMREAVESLEEAARLQPRNGLVQAELARLLVKQGLRLRAQRALEASLRLAPQDPAVKRIAEELAGLLTDGQAGTPEARRGGLLDRFRQR